MWQTTTSGARSLSDLPPAARRYLDRVEEVNGAPIRMLSVGDPQGTDHPRGLNGG